MNLLETRKTSKRELIEERRQHLIKVSATSKMHTLRFGDTLTEKDGMWEPCIRNIRNVREWVEKGYPAEEGNCSVCKRSVEPDEPIIELYYGDEYDNYFYICKNCLRKLLNKVEDKQDEKV